MACKVAIGIVHCLKFNMTSIRHHFTSRNSLQVGLNGPSGDELCFWTFIGLLTALQMCTTSIVV